MTNRNSLARHCRHWLFAGALMLVGASGLISCSGYDLDENDPSWLGSSIYNYLQEQGNYTNMVRIIDELGYREVLAKTGSKTLFVADDEAFNRFYSHNAWGVHSYEQLTKSQKKLLLFGSMINNSMQINSLSSVEGPIEGECMRRLSATTAFDSVPVLTKDEMPANRYWQRYRDKGQIVCMEDMTIVPMVHFIEQQLANKHITNEDYQFLFNKARISGDASVNGVAISEPNIKCSNGFIHKAAEVITPLPNMAAVIAKDNRMSIFNNMLERFCAPYWVGEANTINYNYLYDTNIDSVFQKRFFSEKSQGGQPLNYTPDNGAVNGLLKFDPGWNSYYAGLAESGENVALQRDMAVMMVPSNHALQEYWDNGAGKVLKDYYGSWENVPDKVISKLINNNMLSSFVSSVPSKFKGILNDANDEMGVQEAAIDTVLLACNGAIYLTNRVYSPTAYVSVSFPTLINETMNIMYWGIEQLQYNVYLNSLNSYYSFFVPTNKALLEYVDPCSYGKATSQLFRFHYDGTKVDERDKVWASIWNYDTLTGEVGDSIGKASYDQIRDRLADILDTHIVIGNVEDGNTYYRTKGGTEIKVTNAKAGANGMTVAGSYQINEGEPMKVSYIYDQSNGGNGKTYILDGQPIMGTRRTVADVLSAHEEFSKFYELLEGSGLLELVHMDRNACAGLNISTFNTYHYTVYVPTNASIEALEKAGKLPTWQQVQQEEDNGLYEAKTADSLKIVNFLRYHIQDNALFIGAGNATGDYETATVNPVTGRFYRLNATVNNEGLTIKDNVGNTRHVITTNKELYDLMAREYQYDSKSPLDAGQIETSSSAVVHLIDGPLMYK